MRCAHEMPFGASLHAGGGATFRLWAPAARQAELAVYDGSDKAPRLIAAQNNAQGWWECPVSDAVAGTPYQWRIDGKLLVPDPASRHNPEGPHAPSRVVDSLAFDWDDGWRGRPWHEVVLYELHVGAFTPEGSYAAAVRHLQGLKDLGITAIELMPLANFPGRFGWGYDGVLPFAPHAAYGTPEQLKDFIQQAHRLGLMVFVDVVYNHFGPEGNYLGGYAPQFFSKTHDSPWGAAINYDGPNSRTVRDFFIHNALYWVIEFQVDGLRLDAVHAIVDHGSPHILDAISRAVRGATQGRHVHLVLENERNGHQWLAPRPEAGLYDAQWNDDFHHVLHVALTGETSGYYHDYGDGPLDLLARALSHGMLFAHSPRKPGGAREHIQPAPAQPLSALVNFAHNHDQVGNRARGERLAQLLPPEAAPLATLLALLTPAIPMLFFGEEFGAPEPFLYFADWQGELRDAVREGRKREFGHVDTTSVPLPDPCSADTFAASRPDTARADTEDGQRWLALVRGALAARAQWITPRQELLAHGQHTSQRVGDGGILVQWRYTDGRMLCLELNLSAQPLQVSEQHAGPVEERAVFVHNWPAGTPAGRWPAWAARWTLGEEITL
ncbi:malto-oligosyltrehalose trehalohydrolase [Ramlibacter sp.]|uniref:malto-oligosyltrehalose trehalohydrolase n=1 Tax=Ramlibacter sp. TaxID=1917967 RepID=UPI00178FF81E|nr:malto-oligosyltrehalose trehalohydrolase [Ramlibacter sp.]MBA2676130.1 malto-oligosyltrehalose trehalohydrolase [Ramlibacter sp.]